jgi:hypothetical protein
MRCSKFTLAIAAIMSLGVVGTIAPNAAAKMNDNYVGGTASGALGGITKTDKVQPNLTVKESSNVDFESSIDGRYKIPLLPVSARTSIYTTGLGVQATGTYDLSIMPNVGAYIGGGVHIDQVTSPVLQIGAEAKVGKNTVIYGGIDYLTKFETGVMKAGFGYSF